MQRIQFSNKAYLVLVFIISLFFNRPLQAQLVCGVENPTVDLEWLNAYVSNPIPPSNFLPAIFAFSLDGETYIEVNPFIPDGGTMVFNCAGDLICNRNGLVYPQPTCIVGDTFLGTFGIPGKSRDFPIIYTVCPGESINLSMDEIGAPLPPYSEDNTSFDYSNVTYTIASVGFSTEMCVDCYSLNVSPQITTLYKVTWANELPPTLPNDFFGEGYFRVEVETSCEGETGLAAIQCPENNSTSICAPVSMPAALNLQDFNTTDNGSVLNTLSLQVEEQTNVQKYFTTTTYNYTISDEAGDQKTCETTYHIANRFLEAPEIAQPGIICQEDLLSGIKIGIDQYKIYDNNNGVKGNERSTCSTAGLICSTADFGVDTNIPEEHLFWATTFFAFPDGTICESEATSFNIDVQPKPTAEISVQNKTINIGEGITLMDLVTNNKSGYWSGENIIYTVTQSGDNIPYFSANHAGVYKLYYSVRNDYCERGYLLVVEVASTGKTALSNLSYKTINKSFNIYPNPTTKKVFINLPNETVCQISLTNISGEVIKQFETNIDETIIEISVEDLPKGMYLVELKNPSSYMLQKLIVE